MRIWSPFTFVSIFALGSAIAATACDFSSPDYSSCSDGSYRQYCGSSSYGGYGGSSGYYPTPDAALPATCDEAFSVAFPVPADSGDCQLVLARSQYGLASSSSSSYGSSYGSYANATYYFGQLRSETAATEPCEVISGPSVGRCERERYLVVLASSSHEDSSAMRLELGLQSYDTEFYAQLTCAKLTAPLAKTISFRCGPSTPATPSAGDAGAADGGDAEAEGGEDGGDRVDASPELLH